KIDKRLEAEKQKKIGTIDSKIENLGNHKNQLNGKLGYSEVLLVKLKREMSLMEDNLKKQSRELDKSRIESLDYQQAIDTNVSYDRDSIIDKRNAKANYD